MDTEINAPANLPPEQREQRLSSLSALAVDSNARLHAEIVAAFEDGARPGHIAPYVHFSFGYIARLRREWKKKSSERKTQN